MEQNRLNQRIFAHFVRVSFRPAVLDFFRQNTSYSNRLSN